MIGNFYFSTNLFISCQTAFRAAYLRTAIPRACKNGRAGMACNSSLGSGEKIDGSRIVWRQRHEKRFPLLTHSLTRPLIDFQFYRLKSVARRPLARLRKFTCIWHSDIDINIANSATVYNIALNNLYFHQINSIYIIIQWMCYRVIILIS